MLPQSLRIDTAKAEALEHASSLDPGMSGMEFNYKKGQAHAKGFWDELEFLQVSLPLLPMGCRIGMASAICDGERELGSGFMRPALCTHNGLNAHEHFELLKDSMDKYLPDIGEFYKVRKMLQMGEQDALEAFFPTVSGTYIEAMIPIWKAVHTQSPFDPVLILYNIHELHALRRMYPDVPRRRLRPLLPCWALTKEEDSRVDIGALFGQDVLGKEGVICARGPKALFVSMSDLTEVERSPGVDAVIYDKPFDIPLGMPLKGAELFASFDSIQWWQDERVASGFKKGW